MKNRNQSWAAPASVRIAPPLGEWYISACLSLRNPNMPGDPPEVFRRKFRLVPPGHPNMQP